MPRQNAFLRLRKALQVRRANLDKTLAAEVKNLRDLEVADATGDSADAAFDADSGEVSSQLAQLDSRELSQIEGALARFKQGKYGICENCQNRIPLTRLTALPSATLCIKCERQVETYPGWQELSGKSTRDQIIDSEPPTRDQRIGVSEMELGLARKR
jgi:RNA polymerase-binding transcription factor